MMDSRGCLRRISSVVFSPVVWSCCRIRGGDMRGGSDFWRVGLVLRGSMMAWKVIVWSFVCLSLSPRAGTVGTRAVIRKISSS